MKVSLTTAEKFLRGDENSFAAIYQAYKHLVFFLVRSLLVDQSLAEDCYQETFLKVWETRSNIKSPFAVEKYLLTTARRLAIQKNQKVVGTLDEEHEPVSYEDSYLTDLEASLTPEETYVVVLHAVFDLSFRAIEDLTGIKKSEAHLIYKGAIKKLRSKYEVKNEKTKN